MIRKVCIGLLVSAVAVVNLTFVSVAQATPALTPDCTLDSGATCRILVTDATEVSRWDVPSYVKSFSYKVVAASGQLSMLHNILYSPAQVVQTQAATQAVNVATGTVSVSGSTSIFLAPGGTGISGQRTGGANALGGSISLAGGSGDWNWYPYQGGMYGNWDATIGGGGGAGSALFITSGAAATSTSDRVVVQGGSAASTAKVPDRSVYLAANAGAGGGSNLVSGPMFSNSFSTQSRAWGATGQIEITYANVMVPGVPTIKSVVPGNGQALVDFLAPTSDGGASITGYEYSTDGGSSWTAFSPAQTTSPLVISSLTNGNTYQVVLRAVNIAGPGPASGVVAVTAIPVPDPLVGVVVVSKSSKSVTLHWNLPTSSSPAIQGYVIRWASVNDDTWNHITLNDPSLASYLVSGLAANHSYKFQVATFNEFGTSSAGDLLAETTLVSLSETVSGTVVEHGVLTLNAPAGMVFTRVIFASYGTPNGYSASGCSSGISNQQVSAYFLGRSSASILASNGVFGDPCFGTVKRLTVVLAYGKTEFDVNGLQAGSLNGGLRTSWASQASGNEESHLTYLASTDDGHSCVTASNACDIEGLQNGRTYSVAVTVSDGTYVSDPSNSVSGIPGVRPSAPAIDTYATSDSSVTLSITPPTEFNANSSIGYDFSTDDGLTWSHFASLSGPYLISGLVNGVTYQVRVRAVNVIGLGAPSSAVLMKPIAAPVAPVNLSVSAVTKSSVNLNWEYPDEASHANITDYVVQYRVTSTDQWQVFNDEFSPTTSATVVGLTSGTSYDFRVGAVNSSGTTWAVLATAGDGLNVKVMRTWEGAVPARTENGRSICREAIAPNVDFDWELGAPVVMGSSGSCPSDGFLVHATGYVRWPGAYDGSQTQTVHFYNSADDGFSVSINGAPVIETWQEQSRRIYNQQGALTLLKGQSYAFDVWHYENAGGARMALFWDAQGGISAIPQSNLFTYNPDPSFVSATPVGVADGPFIQSCAPSESQFSCDFLAPSDNGGSNVTGYEYSLDGGLTWIAQAVAASNRFTISDLENGSTYSVRLRAMNAVGAGAGSNVVSVIPIGLASAPSVVAVVADDEQAKVSFVPPATNGGTTITNYEYSTDGGSSWKALSPAQTISPIFIGNLLNGQTYAVSLRAVNAVGSGSASDPVLVKPIAPASAPSISSVLTGNGRVTLRSISAPAQFNDSSLSGYDYSINNGATWSHFVSVDGPFSIMGLTNGTTYQLKVRAVNSAGPGEASVAVAVNPTNLVPAKPVVESALAGNRSAIVKIAMPTDVTSKSITGYQYSIDKGTSFRTASLTDNSFLMSGLTNGTALSVIVRAVNANGTSKVSSAKTVVPATTPEAPVISTITPSTGALGIAFTAPNNGGKAITSYQYSLDGGSTWVVPAKAIAKSPIKITGLPSSTDYQVKIRAVNELGIGDNSASVLASTPAVVASAPTITLASAGKTSITVNFTAPTNNGGAAVTNYAYTVDGKAWITLSPASASTQIVITGLTSYKAYTVKLRAINSAGFGATSASASVKTLK